MACCCTWVIVQACWLLRAPSLSRGSSQHLLRFGCVLPGHSHKLVVQTLSSKSPLLLLRVSVSLCLSPSPRLQGCRYCSVSCLCWSLTLFLWLCTLSDPVSPFSSSFLLIGVPPSHPALGSLSVFCWVCDFGIYPKAAVGSHLCCIWHYLNFSDVWIYSLMSIKMLEAVLARKTPPLAFALNLTASGFDPQLCCWSKLEKKDCMKY